MRKYVTAIIRGLFLTAYLIFKILTNFEQSRCHIWIKHGRSENLRKIYQPLSFLNKNIEVENLKTKSIIILKCCNYFNKNSYFNRE